MIYLTWLYHHNLFELSDRISIHAYFLNGVWVFFLTLIPFLTAWVGQNPNVFISEFLYILDMMLWSLSFVLLDRRMIKDNPEIKEKRSGFLFERVIMFATYFIMLGLSYMIPAVGLYGTGFLSVFLLGRTLIRSAKEL